MGLGSVKMQKYLKEMKEKKEFMRCKVCKNILKK